MATEILPDDRALRIGRRERALTQMQAHDLDILVLGRQANARYISGAPQLWVAGTRPFGPVCTFVRSTGAVHLLSSWDEGMPDDIPHDQLYGLAWNPMTLIDVLKNIEGSQQARRVGTDSLSPSYANLLPLAFPNAEIVDGELAMRAARRVKTPDEVTALRSAVVVAEKGLDTTVAALLPGVGVQTLTGALMEAMTAGGVSTPATQDGAWVTSKEHPWRRAAGDGQVNEGDLVAIAAGVLADGYVGEVGRTWPVGGETGAAQKLYRRSAELGERLIAACKPGAPSKDLLAAYDAAGEPLPAMPVAHGLGLGFDTPVVSQHLPSTAAEEILEPGVVIAVTGYVWESGVGAVFTRDAVLITDDGAEVLTSSPTWSE
jgi:Xaa-Pro dipeptidase